MACGFFIKLLLFFSHIYYLMQRHELGRAHMSSLATSCPFGCRLMRVLCQVVRQVRAAVWLWVHCEESRAIPLKSHYFLGVALGRLFSPQLDVEGGSSDSQNMESGPSCRTPVWAQTFLFPFTSGTPAQFVSTLDSSCLEGVLGGFPGNKPCDSEIFVEKGRGVCIHTEMRAAGGGSGKR